MPKFRWSKDGGSTFTVVDAALPYNIAGVLATDTVIVEPIGGPVSAAGYGLGAEAKLVAWWDGRTLTNGAVAAWAAAFPSGIQTSLEQATAGARPNASAGAVIFDGTNDTLIRLKIPANQLTTATLPDAAGGDAGQGFTITGMAVRPDGARWCANHGLNVQASEGSGTFAPSLVLLSSSDTAPEKLQEILLAPLYPGIQSVQGIVFDELDNTIWFMDIANNKVRHITQAGVPITSDEITPLIKGNGLAIDRVNRHMWVSADTANEVTAPNAIHRYNISTGAFIDTRNVSLTSRDHLFYDEDTQRLFISYQNNSTLGSIAITNISGAVQATIDLDYKAIEGFYIRGGRLIVAFDGWYHNGEFNLIRTYAIPALKARVIDLCVVETIPATTGTDAIFTVGDPVSANGRGFGIFPASTTEMRAYANTGNASPVQLNATGLTLSTKHLLYVRWDLVADAVTIWVNDVQVATLSLAALSDYLTLVDVMRMASAAEGSGRYPSATVFGMALLAGDTAPDRVAVSAAMKAAYGL